MLFLEILFSTLFLSVSPVPINRATPLIEEPRFEEGSTMLDLLETRPLTSTLPEELHAPLYSSPQYAPSPQYVQNAPPQYVPQTRYIPSQPFYQQPPASSNFSTDWYSAPKPNPSRPGKSSIPGIPNKMAGPPPAPLLFPLSPPPLPLPAEECLTRLGEVGECLPAHTCGETDGKMSGLCHQGMDHSMYPRVCCTYEAHCGSSTSKMVSYFTSPVYPQLLSDHSDCNVEVILKPDVCQVRVDFLDFELDGMINGICSSSNQMVISSTVKHAYIPTDTLCGKLSANISSDPLDNLRTDHPHLYLHVEDLPYDMDRKITKMPNPATPSISLGIKITNHPSKWNIRVTQIQCDGAPLQAPSGCSQYYNDLSGTLASLNYNDNEYKTNMDMTACIRTDQKACAIAYSIDDMNIGDARGHNRIGYGLTCGDYISFQGEKTCMCGSAVSREVVLPIRGAQGVHMHSDYISSKSETGFKMKYRYIRDCAGLEYYKYPQLRQNTG